LIKSVKDKNTAFYFARQPVSTVCMAKSIRFILPFPLSIVNGRKDPDTPSFHADPQPFCFVMQADVRQKRLSTYYLSRQSAFKGSFSCNIRKQWLKAVYTF